MVRFAEELLALQVRHDIGLSGPKDEASFSTGEAIRTCVDWLSVLAASIMSASFIAVIKFLEIADFHRNMVALQVFVVLETVAVYSSLGALTVRLLVDSRRTSGMKLERAFRGVVLVSLGCSVVGVLLAWTFLR